MVLYQKLARYADDNKKAKCYWVQILAKGSFVEQWTGDINGKEYNHSRVFKISGDKFYALLSKQDDALFQLYKKLPLAISDYLKTVEKDKNQKDNSVLKEILSKTKLSKRSILDEIAFENYKYYLGFEEL